MRSTESSGSEPAPNGPVRGHGPDRDRRRTSPSRCPSGSSLSASPDGARTRSTNGLRPRADSAGRPGAASTRTRKRPRIGREDPDVTVERPILEEDELESVAGALAPAVLTRLGATIANEACFTLGEGVATAGDINTAMRLGYNWPIGPLEWGERLGWSRVLGLLEELRELQEAYRPAPLLGRRRGPAGSPPSVTVGRELRQRRCARSTASTASTAVPPPPRPGRPGRRLQPPATSRRGSGRGRRWWRP